MDKVSQQNGISVFAHPFTPGETIKESVEALFTVRELPVDVAITGSGIMDLIGRNGYRQEDFKYWWRLLNCNLKVSGSAGTDAMPSAGQSMAGQCRVYVKCGSPLNLDKWLDAYRKGRSFVTSGPYVWLEVNNQEPGSIIESKKGKLHLTITANAASQFGLDRIELVSMGKVIAAKNMDFKKKGTLSCEITVNSNTWILAQAFGKKPEVSHAAFSLGGQFACTNPIHCDLGIVNPDCKKDAAYFIEWIDLFEEYLDKRDRYGSQANKEEVKLLLKKGRDYYIKLLNLKN
jgi:hypothetical protein